MCRHQGFSVTHAVVKTGDHTQRCALNSARHSELNACCLISPLAVDECLPGHSDGHIRRQPVTIQQVRHVDAQQVAHRRVRIADGQIARRLLRRHPQLLPIAKLQFFDVQQTIDAIIQVQRGIRRGVIDAQATVRHTGKDIVAADITVHRDVSFRAVTFMQDFSHNRQLIRFQRAGQHVRFQFGHTFGAGESRHTRNGNTNVEPRITINDIVTSFTHDAVATTTTE